jgi:predicted PurR-regulated permease PerM
MKTVEVPIAPRQSGAETVAADRERSLLDKKLGLGLLLLLTVGCVMVLRPFVSALLWAVVLCYASWPIYRRLLALVGNRRTLAALIMTLGLIVILLLPFLIVGATLAGNVQDFAKAARFSLAKGPPDPPAWLEKLPVIGPKAAARWRVLEVDTAQFWKQAHRFIEPVSARALSGAVALGRGLIQMALSILIALFLFRDGASLGQALHTIGERVAGGNGDRLLKVAGNTVRGVVYGLLGTSLIQAVLAGIGFLIARVPGVGLLVLLTFFASAVPLFGTALVWIPAALWLFHQGATGWGVFMLVWGFGVANIDNIVRPMLISQGSDMPFILILFGVLGGALTFGFIGVFLGPTLLAVGFRLVTEWSRGSPVVFPETRETQPCCLKSA